jgi:hypothetical protein
MFILRLGSLLASPVENTGVPACARLREAGPLAHQSGTFIFGLICHLIISEVSFQEDIDAILTGSKIYLSLVLSFVCGVGDEKKNPPFAFNPSGNSYLVHPFSPRRKGRFAISTGVSLL